MTSRSIPLTLACLLILVPSCGPKPPVDEPPPPAPDAGTTSQQDVTPPPAGDASTAAAEPAEAPPQDATPEQDPGPETIVLAGGTKQGSITFGHRAHEDRLECMACHHEMEDPAAVARACHDCHNPQATDTFGAKKAFHLQCLGCHKKEAGGPTKCAGCHEK